jgi:hypothetical protein
MLVCQGVVILHLDTQKIEFDTNRPKGVSHGLHEYHAAMCRIMQIASDECGVHSLQSKAKSYVP